jgi:hypothetical protein
MECDWGLSQNNTKYGKNKRKLHSSNLDVLRDNILKIMESEKFHKERKKVERDVEEKLSEKVPEKNYRHNNGWRRQRDLENLHIENNNNRNTDVLLSTCFRTNTKPYITFLPGKNDDFIKKRLAKCKTCSHPISLTDRKNPPQHSKKRMERDHRKPLKYHSPIEKRSHHHKSHHKNHKYNISDKPFISSLSQSPNDFIRQQQHPQQPSAPIPYLPEPEQPEQQEQQPQVPTTIETTVPFSESLSRRLPSPQPILSP